MMKPATKSPLTTKQQLEDDTLDFKVIHGSTSGANIYKDIMLVLVKYKHKTMMVMDTVGVTDTTGNMGKLRKYPCNNGHEHTYCTDHNFHLNAKLAFHVDIGLVESPFQHTCL
jgi:hypothetical protein